MRASSVTGSTAKKRDRLRTRDLFELSQQGRCRSTVPARPDRSSVGCGTGGAGVRAAVRGRCPAGTATPRGSLLRMQCTATQPLPGQTRAEASEPQGSRPPQAECGRGGTSASTAAGLLLRRVRSQAGTRLQTLGCHTEPVCHLRFLCNAVFAGLRISAPLTSSCGTATVEESVRGPANDLQPVSAPADGAARGLHRPRLRAGAGGAGAGSAGPGRAAALERSSGRERKCFSRRLVGLGV